MNKNIEIIFELWNKSLKKFKKNSKINFLVIPKILYSEFKVEKKKTVDFKKLSADKLKIEMKVLDTIYSNYKEIFIDNESMKTLNNNIVPPFSIKEKSSKKDRWVDYISFYDSKGKFNVKKTRIFACYSPSDKSFIWVESGTKNNMCENFEYLNNLSFCKYKKILNVDKKTADSLALWFRTTFFTYGFHYPSDKDMKTFNLIKFEMELDKNKQLIMYTLSDYGIKDPDKNTRIQIYDQLDSLNLMIQLLNKNSKVKKLKMEGHKIKFSKKLKNKLNLN